MILLLMSAQEWGELGQTNHQANQSASQFRGLIQQASMTKIQKKHQKKVEQRILAIIGSFLESGSELISKRPIFIQEKVYQQTKPREFHS